MKIVKQVVTALLSIGIAGIANVSLAQDQDFDQVKIETVPVAENIYMLVDVKSRTEKAIAEGLTLEEFIAPKPTSDYDAGWGGGFLKPEQFLTIVYKDLANK